MVVTTHHESGTTPDAPYARRARDGLVTKPSGRASATDSARRASPTSATRAKKASNLLILRSWGRRGRHYKIMLWLGHEAGVGGDLGGWLLR